MKDKKIKYLYKEKWIKAGDWTELYPIGEEVVFKGKNRWLIVDTYYDSLKDRTTIKLEKV